MMKPPNDDDGIKWFDLDLKELESYYIYDLKLYNSAAEAYAEKEGGISSGYYKTADIWYHFEIQDKEIILYEKKNNVIGKFQKEDFKINFNEFSPPLFDSKQIKE